MRSLAKRVTLLGLLVALAAGIPHLALAQGQSTILGVVRDSTNAVLPGATVTLTSPSMLGGARVTTTNAGGGYRFGELTPGDYTLTVELQGFTTEKDTLHVSFGTTVTLDIVVQIAGVSASVDVAARLPVTDVKTASTSFTLGTAVLQNLPARNVGSANMADAINLAPGVIGLGAASRVAFGAPQNANAFILDGVITNELSGGGPAFSGGNNNWLEEVQIVSLGANAQYGGFTGLAANFVFRSGSNLFSGLAEYFTKHDSWIGDNRGGLSPSLQATFTPQRIVSTWNASAQMGGPIQKDKLFFFGGAELIRDDQAPTGSLGGAVNQEHDYRLLGKLSWAPSSKLRVSGYITHSNRDAVSGARPTRQPETLQMLTQPIYNWNTSLNWTLRNTSLLEVRYGGMSMSASGLPIPPATITGPPPRTDSFTGITSANSPNYLYLGDDLHVFTVSATQYVERRLGQSHELKVGFEHSRGRDYVESALPGGMSFTDKAGVPDLVTIREPSITEASNRRFTAYVSDHWILNDRVTLEPGVRITSSRGLVPVKGEVLRTTPIDPRIGIAWDVRPDHKTVVRAHYGRFHDALLTANFSFMDTAKQPPTITARVLANGQFQEINRVTPATNFGIDPNVSQSYMDQYIIGLERELFRDLGLQLQYIRRNSNNFMAFVDTSSEYAEKSAIDPGPDGVAGNADDGRALTVYNLLNPGKAFFFLTNPGNAFRTYDAFQIIGRKRFSNNWQIFAGYTWAKSRGSVDNVSGSGYAAADTGRTGNFANPNKAINRDGRSTNDNTHQVKIQGTYRVPAWGGINLSASYQYMIGAAYSRTVVVRGLTQGNETVRVDPRGAFRTNPINMLDIRAEKTFSLGQQRSCGVYLDAFNIFNRGFSLTINEASGPSFKTPLTYSESRSLRLGVRFTF